MEKPPEEAKKTISVKQAAARLEVTEKTVREWLRSGLLFGYKKGFYRRSEWRVYEWSVERFIQDRPRTGKL